MTIRANAVFSPPISASPALHTDSLDDQILAPGPHDPGLGMIKLARRHRFSPTWPTGHHVVPTATRANTDLLTFGPSAAAADDHSRTAALC